MRTIETAMEKSDSQLVASYLAGDETSLGILMNLRKLNSHENIFSKN